MGKSETGKTSRKQTGACFIISPLTQRIGMFATTDALVFCRQLLQTSSDPQLSVLKTAMNLGSRLEEIKQAWHGCHSHGSWYVATAMLQTWVATCDMTTLRKASSVKIAANCDALISMNEQVFPLGEADKFIGKAKSTTERYCREGATNQHTGEQVYLETITLPGGIGSSIEAFHRFIMLMNSRITINA